MGFRLVALDIDGTLLTSKQELSPRVRKAVRQAQEQGLYITLATGRRFCRTAPWVRALNINIPVVVHNGAVITNPLTGEVVFQKTMKLEAAKSALSLLAQNDVYHIVYTGDSGGEHIEILNNVDPTGRHVFLRYCGDKVEPVKAFNLQQPPIKIAVIDRAEKIKRVLEKLLVASDNLNIMTFGQETDWMGIELLDKSCTKASGVGRVIKSLGVEFSQVLAIGDNINDLELIEWAGFGVAMANAPTEVKEIADYVTGTSDEDGVAQVLEDFVLTAN